MNTSRITGIVLLVLGVVLLIVGLSSKDSFVDQASNAFTGRYTDQTMWYIVGGAVAGVVGIAMLSLGFGKKRA